MTNGEFERLCEKYKKGECTPDEIAFIEAWVELNGEVNIDDSNILGHQLQAAEIEEEMWKNIRIASGIRQNNSIPLRKVWFLPAIAASVAFIILTLFFVIADQSDELAMTGLETFNTSFTEQRIILPDSSVVILAEGASLITDENYGDQNRTVRLTGEAFFDIKRNPNKPFLVYSGDLVTEVLGTSFHVKPGLDKNAIEVSVVTGKVSVYVSEKDRKHRKSGAIIIPNQKVVFNTKLKTIRQDIIGNPKIVINTENESVFKFDSIPVNDVLDVLRKAYGIDIVMTNSGIGHCRFTGDLNGFDLFRQLSYVCDVIDAEYEVRGTTIFLHGNDCQATQ